MADPAHPNRSLLGNLMRIGAGVVLVAAAAVSALENRQPSLRGSTRSLDDVLRDRPSSLRRRKPPEAGIAAFATPPRGPLPMQGGAAARLDFEA